MFQQFEQEVVGLGVNGAVNQGCGAADALRIVANGSLRFLCICFCREGKVHRISQLLMGHFCGLWIGWWGDGEDEVRVGGEGGSEMQPADAAPTLVLLRIS